MPSLNKSSYLTVDEYLAFEESSPVRHEYVDGQVFAMTGVRYRHNIIAGNIFAILHSHVRGSHCRATVSDVKVMVEATKSIYYPDVMVSCGKFDDETLIAPNPVLIIEVLSRSTAAIDRREKLLAYRQIESVGEYLIVHQRKRCLELHRRVEGSVWNSVVLRSTGELVLESVPVGPIKLALDSIYEGVDWNRQSAVREDSEAEYLSGDELDDEELSDEGEEDEGALDW